MLRALKIREPTSTSGRNYLSPDAKLETMTRCSSVHSFQTVSTSNGGKSETKQTQDYWPQQPRIEELQLKIMKLREKKIKMEAKFDNHIQLLKEDLSYLDAENNLLRQAACSARTQIHEMKQDILLIKNCCNDAQNRRAAAIAKAPYRQ